MTQVPKKIAIIGCGPKGLYALDSLFQAAFKDPPQQFDVHVFELSAHPGAGPIYNPGQPEFLLMNFPAHMIDAWTKARGPDLLDWLKATGSNASPRAYVPRAIVGQYLFWCFGKVIDTKPDNVSLTLHTTHVAGLQQVEGRWQVMPERIIVDEALITTGHQDWTRAQQTNDAPMLASPFPTEQALTSRNVPQGVFVACKGFALTFIDVMLALTEGRGGVFCKGEYGYSYRPSGNEPTLIAPFSRTGCPMRAKVERDHFIPPQGHQFWQAKKAEFAQMMTARSDISFQHDVWPALQQISDATLQKPVGSAAAYFESRLAGPFQSERCKRELRQGYDVALGITPPDIGWALGETWRQCYPQIVGWISHREIPADDARLFRHIAAEMERIAFGPPAQNIGKLICLIDAGLVSLDHLSGGFQADVTVNATIPAAGSSALSEPLSGLLRDGYVSVGALGGLRVNRNAQALTDGGTTPGLSIIGRATEGSVLGNDTLSRSLHNLPERWAERVARLSPAVSHHVLETVS